MSDRLQVLSFQPVSLRVYDVGPFQGRMEEVDFTDEENRPCNLFMLLSGNGRGKTTLLECLNHLVGLLDPRRTPETPPPRWLIDHRKARMQLDIRVELAREMTQYKLLLSIMANGVDDSELAFWDEQRLESIDCQGWVRFGYARGHRAPVRLEQFPTWSTDASPWFEDLRRTLSDAVDARPSGFEAPTHLAPTLLFFTANRDIVRLAEGERRSMSEPDQWGWSLARRIDQEGERWFSSPDNLLVWLAWLADGRLERAMDLINQRVFKGTLKQLEGVRKDPPEAIVSNERSAHRLDQLSSGERAMVQILLRLGAHMTLNTWLVIDEADLHLHPRWEHRMMRILKELAANQPGLTIILTAQSRELLQAFAYHLPENARGLRKGGHFIERDLDIDDEGD